VGTLSTALVGSPRLVIAEHFCVCAVLFFAPFILLVLPELKFWGVLLTALESAVSPVLVPGWKKCMAPFQAGPLAHSHSAAGWSRNASIIGTNHAMRFVTFM
jgi:hypothetical protein